MRLVSVAGALAAVLVLVSGNASDSAIRQGWTLRVGVEAESDLPREPSLADLYDPLTTATCAKLVDFTSELQLGHFKLYPEVASRLPSISSDGRTYVFTIRRGFRFSDGSPITAANYAAAFRRIVDPAMHSPNEYAFPDLKLKDVSSHGRQLVVTLRKPSGDFLARVAGLPFVCPIPTDLPTDPEGVSLLVRSGPYFVASYLPNRELVLRRNPGYVGPRRHGPAEIDVEIGMSSAEEADAIAEGRLDYTLDPVPADVVAQLRARYRLGKRLFEVPLLKTDFVAFNNLRPLLRGNVRLRRAINIALDRPALVRALGLSLAGKATDQLLPPEMPGFRNVKIYPTSGPNLRRARRLAAGHLRGGHAVLYTAVGRTEAAEAVKLQLGRIGLHVRVETVPGPVYFDAIERRNPPFDLTLLGWVADFPDPGNFFLALLQNQRWLYVPAVAAQASAVNTLGRTSRFEAFGRLDVRLLKRQAWLAPIANPFAYAFVSARVGCVRFSPGTPGLIDLTSLCRRPS